MKNKTFKFRPVVLALLLTGMGMAQVSQAADLVAIEGQWSPDGGVTQIPMWGFASDTGQACGSLPTWTVGPQLTDTDLVAGNLTVNLRNCLSEPVSIIITGQPASFAPVRTLDGRVRSFTTEAAALGGLASYTWTGVKAGTFLYQSGSHPAKQVQMGLYGALTVGSYPGTSGDVTLLYSEIDPALHTPPAAATPLGYNPSHYLVNGSASQPALSAGDTNQPTVLRFLNAGLDFHVPALNGSHMSLIAEDGHPYPFAKREYSATLSAGKTIDALWQPGSAGDHVIYDRRGNGMAASLAVTAGVGAPVISADSYAVNEDASLVTIAGDLVFPGVLDNDAGPGVLTAVLVSAPSSGTLSPGLAGDGSFTYTPNADFNGTDSFTYKANDGVLDSDEASVTIAVAPVNDAPVANDNAYDAIEATVLSVTAPGVLGNDSDIDGDGLNAVLASPPAVGSILLNADGSFVYDPQLAAVGSTSSFTYFANDGTANSAIAATVTINIIGTPNSAPVAVEDTATVLRNSAATFINLTDNDTDADGNLKDGLGNVASSQITVTTGTSSTRGGTVSVLTNGVNYTPKRNFRGTDTFNYTVTDLAGEVSNEVAVKVNVVK
jgi:hypothetical protein